MFLIPAILVILEYLVFLPLSYTILQFVLPSHYALFISGVFCVVSFFASWLCKLSIKSYLYKLISFTVSVLIALATVKISFAAVPIIIICLLVFILVRIGMNPEKDNGMAVAYLGFLINIVIALINIALSATRTTTYSNVTILISTISSVILMILNQVNDSRKFGRNSMGISSSQKKNNRIFAGSIIFLLLVISSVGQVSNIYNWVLKAFAEFVKLLQYLFTFLKVEDAKQQPSSAPDTVLVNAGEEPSILWIILEKIVYAIILVIIVAILGYAIYALTKWLIKVIMRFFNWLKNKEQYTLRVYENGHVDEKESLYNKNLKRMVKKISNTAKSLFEKEIPYNKLPDDKAKIRRLFKYFLNKSKQNGLSINVSSTAEEICSQTSGISPETMQFNNLMSTSYNAARYGDMAPSRQDLEQLESKLLK